jgi:hypothetical protein
MSQIEAPVRHSFDAAFLKEPVMTTFTRPEPTTAARIGAGTALAAILGLLAAANGAWMLAAPASWYGTVPGVAEHGPFNGHFVRDIGIAYATIAAVLGLAAWHRSWRRHLLWLAGLWLGGHAVLHGFEADLGAPVLAGVVLPAVLTAVLALGARR